MAAVQIRLFTKQAEYQVGEEAISVPADVQAEQLNALVHSLLLQRDAESSALWRARYQGVLFDFLVNSTELLRQPLVEAIGAHGFSIENVIPIEYAAKQHAPASYSEQSLSDWVGCCHIFPGTESANARNHAGERFVLAGTYDNLIRIISLDGSSRYAVRRFHSGPVKAVRWLPKEGSDPKNSGFLSASHDQSVVLWRPSGTTHPETVSETVVDASENRTGQSSKGCMFEPTQIFRGHAGSVDCLSVCAADASKFCTGSWDMMLKLWNTQVKDAGEADGNENSPAAGGERISKRRKTDQQTSDTGNNTAAPTGSHVVRVPLVTLEGHTQAISSCAWFAENEIVTAGWDHTVRLWDVERGEVKNKLIGPSTFIALDVQERSGDGSSLIITGSADRFCRLWDLRSHEGTIVKATYSSHSNWIVACKWSPRNEQQFLTASYDHLAKLWDLRSTRVPLYDIQGHTGNVMTCDWSAPDGSFIVTGGADSQLKVFSVPEIIGG